MAPPPTVFAKMAPPLPEIPWDGCVWEGDGLGATKTRLFGKKCGGTPNPAVKKLGETPNPDQNFASAAARRGSGRPPPRDRLPTRKFDQG